MGGVLDQRPDPYYGNPSLGGRSSMMRGLGVRHGKGSKCRPDPIFRSSYYKTQSERDGLRSLLQFGDSIRVY